MHRAGGSFVLFNDASKLPPPPSASIVVTSTLSWKWLFLWVWIFSQRHNAHQLTFCRVNSECIMDLQLIPWSTMHPNRGDVSSPNIICTQLVGNDPRVYWPQCKIDALKICLQNIASSGAAHQMLWLWQCKQQSRMIFVISPSLSIFMQSF